MDLKIETDKGWTEAIIDDDCEFVKFYRIGDVLRDDFNLSFTRDLDDYDTLYKDFDFKDSKLSLCYNIYLGVSIFPIACKNASLLDNEHVVEIGQLLFDKVIDFDWEPFENGNTIGQPGTEGGKTIVDLENLKGARITLEEHGKNESFSITMGIYGLMMHTHFENDFNMAREYVNDSKFKINKIIDMYDLDADKRSDYWQTKLYKMIDELAEMTDIQPSAADKEPSPSALTKPAKTWWKKLLGI